MHMYVWWPRMGRDIKPEVRSCGSAVPHYTRTTSPEGPWQQIHVDFAGPF